MITLYDGWMMRCWLLPGPAWVLGPGVHAIWMGRAKGGTYTVCDTVCCCP